MSSIENLETFNEILNSDESLGKVVEVKSLEQRLFYIKESRFCIVKVGAEWCGPCKKIIPELETMASIMIDIAFLSENISEEFGSFGLNENDEEIVIKSLPTFLFFVRGKFVELLVGSDLKKVRSVISQYVF